MVKGLFKISANDPVNCQIVFFKKRCIVKYLTYNLQGKFYIGYDVFY